MQQLKLPQWWYSQAACRPGVSGLDPTAWVQSDTSLDAELAAAAAAAADMVTPTMPRYQSYFEHVGRFVEAKADEAREVCLLCPAVIECLEQSLDTYEGVNVGLFGACGEQERTILRSNRALPETCDTYTEGCRCRYCAKVVQFTTPLEAGKVRDRNGANARCGFLSTYGRGHRDAACCWAQAMTSRRARSIDGTGTGDLVYRIDTEPADGCPHSVVACPACEFEALLAA